MTTLEFIFRRLARGIGICNERNHLRVASQQATYLSEAEDLLGRIAWKDVADIPELAQEHFQIHNIFTEQDRLQKEIEQAHAENRRLNDSRDQMELAADERLAAAGAEKTRIMSDAIALMHRVEASKSRGEMTKKKYAGLKLKHQSLGQSGASSADIATVDRDLEKLKVEYAEEKARLAGLGNQIREYEAAVAEMEKKIEGLRREAREEMAELMNRVSKSSKGVADYTAHIGSLDATKKDLFYKVGSYLSSHYQKGNPALKPVQRKHRNILAKIHQLRRSIHYHRLLAGRPERE